MSTDLSELLETFDFLGDDWDERYRYLIDLGKQLPGLSESEQIDAHKVEGCMSQVWLIAEPDGDVIHFRADSDAHIVRGLIAVLMIIFSGKTAQDILDTDVDAIFNQLGLDQHLSPNRRNGFAAMVGRIRAYAQAHKNP